MFKTILTISLVASTFILNGCGSDSDGESRLKLQNMLDHGDFNGVINQLKTKASNNEEYLLLASAYMGKAGYSVLEIAGAMSKDSNDDNLITQLAENASYSSTLDLQEAEKYYNKVIGDISCQDNIDTLDASQKDVCLFIGLSASTKTASTIKLLTDDIGVFADDSNSVDYKLEASTCAMQFAFDNNLSNTDLEDCNFKVASDVNFTVINKIYTPLQVHVKEDENDSNIYHFLLSQENNITHTRSTILTSGYCSNKNFIPRVDDYNTSLYACPINEDPQAEETKTVDVLLDALNNGIDSVVATTTSDDTEIQDNVDEFKCDVLGYEWNDENNKCENNTSSEINVTQAVINEQQIIDYLNSQND